MESTVASFVDTGDLAPTTHALMDWYDEHHDVVRLWAIQPAPTGVSPALRPLRVVLLLQPSPDGDETAAAWMAHGAAWSRELQQSLDRAVQLECTDQDFIEPLATGGEGALVAAFCWRDATT